MERFRPRPKLLIIPALLCLLVPAVHPQTDAEELQSRVAVIPVGSEENDNTFESMSAAINDTVLLTLKLLGKYEVVEDHGFTAFSEDAVGDYAEAENIDNIIFGEVSRGEGGATLITMSVWDRLEKQVVLSATERAESLLDIFDAADRIVVSVIEGFSGRHIGYGSIRLQPSGEDWGFSIELDGNLAGINTRDMGRVLIGEYNLTVRQRRIFGQHLLFSDTVEVKEDETTTVAFHIPVRTEEEAVYFDSLDREIIENWHDPDSVTAIIERIKEAWTLLDDFNREGYWEFQKQKYADWRVEIGARRFELEGSGKRIIENRNTKTLKGDVEKLMARTGSLSNVYRAEDSGKEPQRARFHELQERLLTDLDNSRIPRVESGAIRVDGRRNDWIAVPPALIDDGGDSLTPGSDIIAVKIARDENRVYTLISFGEDNLFSANHVWYQTYIEVPGGNVNLNNSSWDGEWRANLNEWSRETWDSEEIAEGIVVQGRNFLESSFPLSALVNRLGTDQEYVTSAQGGQQGDQLDRVHEATYLRIGE